MDDLAIVLPQWLENLRYCQIVERVKNDPRSVGQTILGFDTDTAQREVLGSGQADFDESWRNLTPEDRVLVYAYLNQLGHLEELVEAFRQIFQENKPPSEPVIIDLGSGPCTGGLAFASVQSGKPLFDYIGVDRSRAMRELGEHLISNAPQMDEVRRQWTAAIPLVQWQKAPGWRPVIVIVSYLLASPTLLPAQLIDQLECLLRKIGNGSVTILYTNSPQPSANRRFSDLLEALRGIGFRLYADDVGMVEINRWSGTAERKLRYALFHRPSIQTLTL